MFRQLYSDFLNLVSSAMLLTMLNDVTATIPPYDTKSNSADNNLRKWNKIGILVTD